MRISSCSGLALSCLMCSVVLVLGQVDEVEDTEIVGTESTPNVTTTELPEFKLNITAINRETNFMALEYTVDERKGPTTFLEITAFEVDDEDDEEDDTDDTVIHSGQLELDAPRDKETPDVPSVTGVYELNHLQSTSTYKVCINYRYNKTVTEATDTEPATVEEETVPEMCELYETIGVIHTKELLVMLCVLGYFALCIIGGYCCYSSKKSKLEAAAAEEEAEEEEKEPIAEPEMVAAAPVANVNSAPPPRPAKSPIEADVPFATPPYQDLSEEDKLSLALLGMTNTGRKTTF